MAKKKTIKKTSRKLSTSQVAEPTSEEGLVQSSDSDEIAGGNEEKMPRSTQLLNIMNDCSELWHSPAREAFASIEVDGHTENWLIDSKDFSQWLQGQYFDNYGRLPSNKDLEDALHYLKGIAIHRGEEHQVFLRTADLDKKIVVDLCNSDWEAVTIDEDGWSITNDPGVKFRRTPAMLPLPTPQSGGSIFKLQQLLNVMEKDWPLIMGWLVTSLLPRGPFCVLILTGEQGTAKTTTARVLRALVDPNASPVRATPRNEDDLMVSALNSWIVCFDNVSHIKPDLSDSLCRLSTGAALAKRTHYSNTEETIIQAKRPVLLTAIDLGKIRSDLLDRSILVELQPISREERRTESEVTEDLESLQAETTGALFEAISHALRSYDHVSLERLPRMADMAKWATSAEESFGFAQGAFVDALRKNENEAHELALEGSLVATTIRQALQPGMTWTVTATQLHRMLLKVLGGKPGNSVPGIPRDSRLLSQELGRLSPNLRSIGIEVSRHHKGRGKKKRRVIRLRNTNKPKENG